MGMYNISNNCLLSSRREARLGALRGKGPYGVGTYDISNDCVLSWVYITLVTIAYYRMDNKYGITMI
jgi:hypothetical protein